MHASGVLAALTGDMVLSRQSSTIFDARVRLAAGTVWNLLFFARRVRAKKRSRRIGQIVETSRRNVHWPTPEEIERVSLVANSNERRIEALNRIGQTESIIDEPSRTIALIKVSERIPFMRRSPTRPLRAWAPRFEHGVDCRCDQRLVVGARDTRARQTEARYTVHDHPKQIG